MFLIDLMRQQKEKEVRAKKVRQICIKQGKNISNPAHEPSILKTCLLKREIILLRDCPEDRMYPIYY